VTLLIGREGEGGDGRECKKGMGKNGNKKDIGCAVQPFESKVGKSRFRSCTQTKIL
jgi:hypothetical protein